MSLKNFSFNVKKKCEFSRTGLIETHRGNIQTPVFMPVGTQGTVKGIFSDDILPIAFFKLIYSCLLILLIDFLIFAIASSIPREVGSNSLIQLLSIFFFIIYGHAYIFKL